MMMGLRASTILAALAAGSAAHGTEPKVLGTWLIADARPAPWANSGEIAASAAEKARLVGRRVVYRKARIEAPPPLSCSGPRYRFVQFPPEGVFQGGLTDPVAQAQALGLPARAITTLETGCAGWIDFHFADATTALFALNNLIYTLRKQ